MSQPAAAAGSAGAGDAAPGGGRFRGRGEKKKDAADRPFTLKVCGTFTLLAPSTLCSPFCPTMLQCLLTTQLVTSLRQRHRSPLI